MKILFVVPYAPTLIRVRPYQLIRALARQGHQVTLATLWTSESERDSLACLAAEGIRVVAERMAAPRMLWNALLALPTGTPLQAAVCWQPALARRLLSLLREPDLDIVHVEHLRGARYGLWALQTIKATASDRVRTDGKRPAVVWDSVDCISHLFAQAARDSRSPKGRLMARLDLARTRRYEGWLVSRFPHLLVTSEVDRQSLLGLSGRPGRISVLPNGVDLEYFRPLNEPRAPSTVVITGKMSYHANVTAVLHLVRDIMPHVWARRPDVCVSIVGKDPAREIRSLETQARWLPAAARPRPDRATGQSRICVVGAVADMRPYLRQATVAVAPVLYGAGIQNKVLEAMACEAPVVATPQATAALAARPDRDLLLGRTPEEFARSILALLDAPDRRLELGRAGRTYVERHHDWVAMAARLEHVYLDAMARVSGIETDSVTPDALDGPLPDHVRIA